MSDLITSQLPVLRSHRLPGLDFGDDLQYPVYDGYSVLNIPSGVCRLLGVPPLLSPPLADEVLAPLRGEAKRVILILVDGLALHWLQKWLEAGSLPGWQSLIERGVLAPLTSIVPSTTSAALTSLWSGAPPAVHGIAGYEMWLKEYGIVANMIEQRPISYQGKAGHLRMAGFDAGSFLSVGTLGRHLQDHGISSHAFQHHSIIHSGLSQMFMDGVESHGFQTAAELWVKARKLLEERLDERMYLWVYWGALDSLSHYQGPDDESILAEFIHFSQAFEQFFLQRLDEKAKKDTVLLFSADHGHIRTDPHHHRYQAANHPDLMQRLHILPTGENRLTYLHVQPGQVEAVREYIQQTWPDDAVVEDSEFALEQGLFGTGKPHQEMSSRLGDLVVAWRGEAYLWWAPNKRNHLIGRHGGMSPEEMLVPLLGIRLG